MASPGTPALPMLYERELELDAIDQLCHDVARGEGRVLAVRGQAGMGKSRLVAHAATVARGRGMVACVARGAEYERSWTFGIARQLLEGLIRDCPQRSALFAGAGKLARSLRDGEAPSPLSDAGFAVMHGLVWACTNASEYVPVLLVVDDAQWGDEPSLRWLAFLARRIEELRVGLLVAQRPDEVTASPALLELLNAPATNSVTLRALSRRATVSITCQRFGPSAAPAFGDACWHATGGNPFFVHTLLDALAADGVQAQTGGAVRVAETVPTGITEALLIRLSRLGSDALEVARCLAVLGDESEPAILGSLASLTDERCRDALDALARVGMITANAGVAFAHPIVRAAVYNELPPFARAERHAHAAVVLRAAGAWADRVVSQLLRSGPVGGEWVIETLRQEAAGAAARGAPELAARLLARALDEPLDAGERPQILLELGLAETRQQDAGGVAHLREALDSAADPTLRAEIGVALASALVSANRAGDAMRLIDELGPQLTQREHEQAMQLDILAQIAVRDTRALKRWEREALAASTPAARALLGFLAFNRALAAEPVADVLALARAALTPTIEALDLGHDPTFAPVFVLTMADAFAEANTALSDVIDAARSRGSLAWFVSASATRSYVHYRAGALAESEADARQALSVADTSLRFWVVQAAVPLALALTDAGRTEEAREVLTATAQEGLGDDSAVHQRALVDYALGAVAAASGDFAAAAPLYLAAGERMEQVGSVNPAALDWRSPAAAALIRCGDGRRARALTAEAVTYARRFGAASALGAALRSDALVQDNVSIDGLTEAVTLLAAGPARIEYARALLDYGAALRRQRERRAAREPLRDAMDTAARCGAAPLVARAREELIAAGARPRRELRRGPDAMTASEVRIARMAASGLSNPEIAQALFVTARTVESHLGHVYRKLDIHGRDELATRLTEASES